VWQTDNRGNRVIVASDSSSAINIPAVGAALVVKRYMAQVPDEISLEVTIICHSFKKFISLEFTALLNSL